MNDPYLPHEAEIVSRRDETKNIITLGLRFSDPKIHQAYTFTPGQFNMLYLYGVGELAISIVSDPREADVLEHTIRIVGRVTKGFAQLKVGDRMGVRGPFGRGWPLALAKQKDILIATGGLGCAPAVSAINYIMRRRDEFGKITILQGIKHSDDHIYKKRYAVWKQQPDVEVFVAADVSGPAWPFHTGRVTDFIDQSSVNFNNTIAMMCGPEAMMTVAVKALTKHQVPHEHIYLSMERNMQCAVAHCGHCQYGAKFVCKDGPVFSYSEVSALFTEKGF